MYTAALRHTSPIDPDRLSFAAALRATHRSATALTGDFFPPDHLSVEVAHFCTEIWQEINPPRWLRTVLRQVKRKMSKFLAWNPIRTPPVQPTRTPPRAVKIIQAAEATSDP
ncbi:hypothetical protein GCM10020000_14110 [Streptomyces olivoverticillatus]